MPLFVRFVFGDTILPNIQRLFANNLPLKGDQPPDCTIANYWTGGVSNHCMGDTTAVGSYPTGASPYHAMDMAGNVWEWINDWYQSDYYLYSPYSNPLGPATGTYKVLWGGSFGHESYYMRVPFRDSPLTPIERRSTLGFRCAVSTGP